MPGQRAAAALAGDDGRDALCLQPLEQTTQFRAQDRLVVQATEQRLYGVDDDALGANGVDGEAQPDEQAT